MSKPDPRDNPPAGHRYVTIVSRYKGVWYDGVGATVDVGKGKLVPRTEAGDGSCYFFERIRPEPVAPKAGRWQATQMDCDACGYHWAAAHPVEAEYLMCPICRHMTPAPAVPL